MSVKGAEPLCDIPPADWWQRGVGSPMPQTSKEKQEAFRARNAMLGKTEVRGIFLPPEKHAELKAYAAKLAKIPRKSPQSA